MLFRILIFITFIAFTHSVQAQNDPVVFTVDGDPVLVSEFEYIYNKNNNDKNKYSEASIREYLDLYTKFKLKVKAARDMGLDTIPSLQEELAGYQKQLAESYLTDKKMKESVYTEAYERSGEDVEVQHIFVKIDKITKDTVEPLKKIRAAYAELNDGADWNLMVAKYSQDQRNNANGGNIGYVNAPLPSGYYDLETAIYTTPIGEFSQPLRSPSGFHIVRPKNKREARGEVEVAHILIRNRKTDDRYAKTRIDSAYALLKDGVEWNEVLKKYTEDKNTKGKQGYLGWVAINKYLLPFENAAFSLKEDGAISRPVLTTFGYHIIKRISKKERPAYDIARYSLEKELANSARIMQAERDILNSIRKDSEFKTNTKNLDRVKNSVDSTIFVFSWDGLTGLNNETLATMKGGSKIMVEDLNKYLLAQKGKRLRLRKTHSPSQLVESLWEQFTDDQLINYEKTQLAEKYPDFKALMREYDEGILLFEATRLKVWDYAGQDTIGLKKYFDEHQDKYQWGDRAELITYDIGSKLKNEAEAVQRYAKDNTPTAVYTRFADGDFSIKYTSSRAEQDRLPEGLKLAKGAQLLVPPGDQNDTYTLYHITAVIPAGPRSLEESKGFVIADYQDVLEKEWIQSLKNKYAVKVNEKTIKSLIKN